MSAQVAITQLPTAGAITGTEVVPVVQNGVTVQTTTAAISSTSNQTQTFLTKNQEVTLPNSRYLSTSTGLTLTDGGAQSFYRIAMSGAAESLNAAPNGVVVKDSSGTVINRLIAVSGSGLSVSNADGVSGDPTLELTGIAASIAALSGTGLLALTGGGTSISGRTLAGTASQIDIANADGAASAPSFSIADNAVLPGTGGVVVPAGTTGQRGTSSLGKFRYNTTTNSFEGYNGTWNSFAVGASVSSISFGTTGLTPATATTGAVTVAGTLAVANGGTGVTTSTGTTNVVLSNSPTLVTPILGVATGTSFQGIIGNVTPAAGAFTSITASTTLGVTGVSTFAAGTAALPGITTTGDTNTGIFFPAADTLGFTTGGTERMRIDAAGNVGIGATSVDGRLHVRQDQNGTTRSIIQNRNSTGTPISELTFITGSFSLSDNRYAFIQSVGGSSNSLIFGTSNAGAPVEAMRIGATGLVTVTGTLKVSTGAAVGGATPGTGGLAFPATAVAVADANTLDDYEEGTWTPVVTFTGGNGDLTTAVATGVYTKIGRLVQIAFAVEFTETTALTNLTVTGVPFTSGGTLNTVVGCLVDNMTTLVGSPVISLGAGSTTITLFTTGTGGLSNITNLNTGASSRVRGSLSYSI